MIKIQGEAKEKFEVKTVWHKNNIGVQSKVEDTCP